MGRSPSTSAIDDVKKRPSTVDKGAKTLKPNTAYTPIASSTSAYVRKACRRQRAKTTAPTPRPRRNVPVTMADAIESPPKWYRSIRSHTAW